MCHDIEVLLLVTYMLSFDIVTAQNVIVIMYLFKILCHKQVIFNFFTTFQTNVSNNY